MESLSLYKRLLGYIRPYWKMVVLMLSTTAIYALTEPLLVKTLEPLINRGFVEKEISAVNLTILAIFIIIVVRGAVFFLKNYSSRWITSQVVFDIRAEMFAVLHALPTQYFDKHNSGGIISRFNYDVQQVTSASTNALITLVQETLTIIALLAFLFYENFLMTLSILILTPAVAIIILKISKRLRRLAKEIQGDMGDMNHILDENIKGQKIVKVYHGQHNEKSRFRRATRRVRNAAIKSEVAASLSTPIIEFLMFVLMSLVILYMAHEAREDEVSVGGFVTYLMMMAMLFRPIKKLTRINEYIQKGLAASESIFSFIDNPVESIADNSNNNQSTNNASTQPVFSGNIEFRHVGFSYYDEKVLSNFNLTIKAGETIALVGASGSGKSTVAALIPRFYDIDEGDIKLDGLSTLDMDLELLRQQISFVNQEIVLFDDTVTRNIAYGEKNIDETRVLAAAQSAFAHDFIMEMEQGYDTVIGESGVRLSGGQKQRLSIARAIYKNAPIFILDEATSALDSESELKVQNALETLIEGRTSIIIAHRLSTIRNATRIVVLDKGQIVETGNHEALLENQGVYYNLTQLGSFS